MNAFIGASFQNQNHLRNMKGELYVDASSNAHTERERNLKGPKQIQVQQWFVIEVCLLQYGSSIGVLFMGYMSYLNKATNLLCQIKLRTIFFIFLISIKLRTINHLSFILLFISMLKRHPMVNTRSKHGWWSPKQKPWTVECKLH